MDVALASIALAGTTVGALVWFMKWLANKFIAVLEAQINASKAQKKSMLG